MIRTAWVCLMLVIVVAQTAAGQVKVGESGELSGTVFADYYWFASSHNADLEGNNGFWFRRIYLTYDHQISNSFSSRLRIEMQSEGDFITNSTLQPQVKDAWLKWSNDNHAIKAGITPTPTWRLIEEVWGYRSVEQSPPDLYNFGSSRDFGISFKGDIDAADKFQYHFMFANGGGTGTELNKGKKLMLALSYNLTDNFVVQAYGDWNDNPDNTDIYTLQGFAGYQSDGFNAGALYAYQFRNNATVSGDLNLDLVSLFANASVTEKVKAFARVDHLFDRYRSGPNNNFIPFSDQAESTFLVGGADITLHEKVHLLPNVEAIIYGENAAGLRPKTDLIPRLTLSYVF